MLTITESVNHRIVELIQEENNPNLNLRVFVQGGGCSGFQYGFTFDEDQNEDDFVIEQNGLKYLIDAMSMQYLEGDFQIRSKPEEVTRVVLELG